MLDFLSTCTISLDMLNISAHFESVQRLGMMVWTLAGSVAMLNRTSLRALRCYISHAMYIAPNWLMLLRMENHAIHIFLTASQPTALQPIHYAKKTPRIVAMVSEVGGIFAFGRGPAGHAHCKATELESNDPVPTTTGRPYHL